MPHFLISLSCGFCSHCLVATVLLYFKCSVTSLLLIALGPSDLVVAKLINFSVPYYSSLPLLWAQELNKGFFYSVRQLHVQLLNSLSDDGTDKALRILKAIGFSGYQVLAVYERNHRGHMLRMLTLVEFAVHFQVKSQSFSNTNGALVICTGRLQFFTNRLGRFWPLSSWGSDSGWVVQSAFTTNSGFKVLRIIV